MGSWLEDLANAGSFRAAARRFVDRFGAGVTPPEGVEGLIALSRSIDRFAEDGEPADDDAFLEGAGALLAAIVIASHGKHARHASSGAQHRVQLGPRGFFDPFRAVSSALTSESRARPVLVRELLVAEAEGRDEGPISRVSSAFERSLAAKRPELSVAMRFDRELVLSDETCVDLSQVIAATEAEPIASPTPRSVELAAAKLVDMLPGGRGAALTLADALPRLFPRLLGASLTSETSIFSTAFRGPVRIGLVARFEDRARFVVVGDLVRWQAEADTLLLRALDNLALASASARIQHEPPLYYFRSGDGLDSARLLLPGLHETLAPRLGASFLAAVPHRDVLLLAGEDGAHVLAARARDDFARAPHRISDVVYRVDGEGIVERSS